MSDDVRDALLKEADRFAAGDFRDTVCRWPAQAQDLIRDLAKQLRSDVSSDMVEERPDA